VTPKAVLFDWDGTLVDTAEASFNCYVRMFETFGIPFDRDAYARTYSPNWYRTFEQIGLAREHWREADTRWLSFFAEETCTLIDGARELLETLTARGIAAGIVTSGGRDRVTRELEIHGLTDHVREAVFGCDVENKKPHPEALNLCLTRLGIPPTEAAYVGDSPEDVAMARAAGVYSIAIPGPYPNRAALGAAGADVVVPSLVEVLELCTQPRAFQST
jgi:HAD superfamily hydrolase (TIGR01549 family)